MKYKGIELVEITEPQVFDPPKKLVVLAEDSSSELIEKEVTAIMKDKRGATYAICQCEHFGFTAYRHCYKIPEDLKYVTNRQLAEWLAQGNGEVLTQVILPSGKPRAAVAISWHYFCGLEDEPVEYRFGDERCKGIRRWGDASWHAPTLEYAHGSKEIENG